MVVIGGGPAGVNAALQAAENIYAELTGGQKKYIPRHVGEVVSIGRKHAVGELSGIKLTGILARAAKKLIHLWYVHSIGGFRLMLEDVLKNW